MTLYARLIEDRAEEIVEALKRGRDMIPCWTAPMVVPKEESAPKVEDIVTDIKALTEAIKLVDQKLALLATVTHEALEGIKGRIQKLEKRHTAHLHWTNMGR